MYKLFKNIDKKINKIKIKMSEQFQAVLSEMENKFQSSFSELNLDQTPKKDLNPQSAKKLQEKTSKQPILTNIHFDQYDSMKNQLQQQLMQSAQEDNKNNLKNNSKVQKQVHCKQDKHQNQRQNTPNFNFKNKKQIERENDKYDLRKVQSSNQHTFHNYNQPQNHQKDFQLNPYYYQQLTMKLERALNKISSHQNFKTNNSQNKNGLTFYDRLNQFEQKKIRQIERKKNQQQQNQIKQLQSRPLINSHSRKIISQLHNDPIFIRCDKILEQKKKKQQHNKILKLQKQEKQYQQFRKQYENHMNKIKQKYNQKKCIRSSQQYYHQMDVWLKNRQKNIQSRKCQQIQKQKNQNTFKPIINSKSQKIILNKKQQRRVPIHDRQPKPKAQIQDSNCTFKPKINKSNFYKKMNFYQTPF